MPDIKTMIYSVFDPVTGQILATINDSTESGFPANSVMGNYNDQEHYFDLATHTIIDKPASPSACHAWNANTKTWDLDTAQATIVARQQRDQRLSEIDRVNPIWYASLTAEQQQELIAYRQQLLDVPQQESFPTAIDWPNWPSWL